MDKDSIIIKKLIVHILDSTVGMPVLSDTELDFGPDLSDFFKAHIDKIANTDDNKRCEFMEESEVLTCLKQYNGENFIPFSHALASGLFEIMYSNPAIPPADLAIIHFSFEGQDYIGLLKLNYKTSYTHMTQSKQEGNENKIILQQAILPSMGQRLSEACIINLNDYSIVLVEKKFEINDKKINYFSSLYMKCHAPLSTKVKLDIVTKAVEQVNSKYYAEDDFDRKMEVKKVIYEELEEHGNIRVEAVKEKLFHNNQEMKQEFEEKVEKYNLSQEELKPKHSTTTKKFQKQRLTTDTGIELTIPMEDYTDTNKVEFITNEDGTISILIKNIGQLLSK